MNLSYLVEQVRSRRFTLIIGLTVLIGVAVAIGYHFGKNTTMHKNNLYEVTPKPTVKNEQISLHPSLVPSQSTTYISDFQKCLSDVATDTQKKYEAFCDKWKREHLSEDCPGFDEIGIPGEECYKQFGVPTPTVKRYQYLTCPPGWISVCQAGMCDCQVPYQAP